MWQKCEKYKKNAENKAVGQFTQTLSELLCPTLFPAQEKKQKENKT